MNIYFIAPVSHAVTMGACVPGDLKKYRHIESCFFTPMGA